MDDIGDDHVVDTIRKYVRQHPDIQVIKNINRGINGDVYVGKRVKLNDEVVLKFYWSYEKYDASEEAVILRNIEHPNILRVLDVRFVKPHYAYFVTPRIAGGDLQEVIDRGPMATRDALELVAGILSGVTELHSTHQLVHRDLKPGNILFDTKRRTPIIADLGAVKKIDRKLGYTSESKSTLFYLPPEAVVDNKYLFQSDIYQVGLIMFQLLGGFFPLNDPKQWLTAKELKVLETITNENKRVQKFDDLIKQKIFDGKLALTSKLPPYLDSGFARVLNKALHHDLQKRYKTASEFVKDIHKLLASYPSYQMCSNYLLVSHTNGREFKISENDGLLVLQKKLPGKAWRTDNTHDGTFKSALTIAREF